MPDTRTEEPENRRCASRYGEPCTSKPDRPPRVFDDELGLKLVAPDEKWRSRPDMSPFTRPFRASIEAGDAWWERLVASGLRPPRNSEELLVATT